MKCELCGQEYDTKVKEYVIQTDLETRKEQKFKLNVCNKCKIKAVFIVKQSINSLKEAEKAENLTVNQRETIEKGIKELENLFSDTNNKEFYVKIEEINENDTINDTKMMQNDTI